MKETDGGNHRKYIRFSENFTIISGWIFFLYLFVLNAFPVCYKSNSTLATALYTIPGWFVFFVWTWKLFSQGQSLISGRPQADERKKGYRTELTAWSIESFLVFIPWLVFFGIFYGFPWTWYRHQEIIDWGWGVVCVFLVPIFFLIFVFTWIVAGYLKNSHKQKHTGHKVEE